MFEPLLAFLKEKQTDADVFCFQEMTYGTRPEFTSQNMARENLFAEISSILHDFVAYEYRAPKDSCFAGEDIDFDLGQAIFVHKGVSVLDAGGFRTYSPDSPIAADKRVRVTGNCQWVKIQHHDGAPLLILNLHGVWQESSNKMDTPARIEQSHIIRKFMDEHAGSTVLVGDFNMRPQIESMQILSAGMRDLVQENHVAATRSSLYEHVQKSPFSDYVFTSPEIEVKDFKVLDAEVSDHLPLFVEIVY